MRSYLSPLLWSFLPDKITQSILPFLSSSFPTLLPPAPQGTETWRSNYRRVLTCVVLAALSYNFWSTAAGEVDWYQMLGVGPRCSDEQLKKAFRQLSRLYHPDRLGPNAGPDAEAQFIAIRQAYEVLTDPVKRFAYDRFGPSIAAWQKVDGAREYILKGVQNSAGFYIGIVGLMLVLGLLGRAQQGAYWRNLLLGVLLIFETTLILTPIPGPNAPASAEPLLFALPRPLGTALSLFLPRSFLARPPYQHIALLHRLFTDACIAISQLAYVWSPRDTDTPQRTLALAGLLNAEAVSAFRDEIGPILAGTNDPAAAERNLLERMEKVFLDRAMEAHPAIGPIFEAAVTREVGRHRARSVPHDTLAVAQSTPLPPSPPGSPAPGVRRRSPRFSG